MAYKIGQIRKNDISYLTTLTGLQSTTVATQGFATVFYDYALHFTDDNISFSTRNTYYLRFSVRRYNFDDFPNSDYSANSNDPRVMFIRPVLYQHDGKATSPEGQYLVGEYQSISSTLRVDPYIPNINSEYATFELMFTPNNTYSYLAFLLNRCSYDYSNPQGVRSPFVDENRLDYTNRGDFAIINNILPIPAADKIGIQSRPGVLVCINKEPIRIGKSGVYEVNNGVPVTFIGMTAPGGSENVDKFILDYAWNEE